MLDFYKTNLFMHIFVLISGVMSFLRCNFGVFKVDMHNWLIIKVNFIWVKIFTICGDVSVEALLWYISICYPQRYPQNMLISYCV